MQLDKLKNKGKKHIVEPSTVFHLYATQSTEDLIDYFQFCESMTEKEFIARCRFAIVKIRHSKHSRKKLLMFLELFRLCFGCIQIRTSDSTQCIQSLNCIPCSHCSKCVCLECLRNYVCSLWDVLVIPDDISPILTQYARACNKQSA